MTARNSASSGAIVNVLNVLWAVYQLADDVGTYGRDAGKYIITADEHDIEVTGVIHDLAVAEAIVEAHNFQWFSSASGAAVNANTITLYLACTGWMAHFAGPHAATVHGLFGTCDVPTAFAWIARPEQVLASIQASNPDARVSLQQVAYAA